MFQLSSVALLLVSGLVQPSVAQFSPPVTYDTVLNSPINPNITISYKTPDPDTCKTVFENQTQYTGYVTLPPYTLAPFQQNYTINTFFWFVESRANPETAPLTIWLNGGPGSSSMLGFFTESGPCEVVQLPDGGYGTQSSLWGWDRSSNMLFIDQPTQTGFSYDEKTNGTVNLSDYSFVDPPVQVESTGHDIELNGTLSTGNEYSTQNTSLIAASASWHFLQGFLSAFPQYNPGTRPNSTTTEPTGINLFAESYGGQYGPAFADFFESQNTKRLSGEISPDDSLEVKLSSLGIINGLVDEVIQAPWWPKFAFNNTYGIKAMTQTEQLNALSDIQAPGGCNDLVGQCRDSLKKNDPLGEGDDPATNDICAQAAEVCTNPLNAALESGRSPYDIRIQGPDSFPSYAFMEYLNTAAIQQSIGAGINFTQSNFGVFAAFAQTGDEVRGTQLASLANLLAKGIQVAFIYGDADIICNWRGGEEVALEVARLNPSYSTAFPAAGYADIVVNSTYVGGQVRQYGNLSFARVFDAGHTVPSYQPETAFTVFTRIINGDDIGMGKEIDRSNFGTQGPSESTHTNKVPEQPGNTCWIRAMRDTCTNDQVELIADGKGVVKFGVFYDDDSDSGNPDSLSPTSTPTPASSESPSIPVTGVFTATETPKVTSGATSLRSKFQLPLQRRQGFFLADESVSAGFKTGVIAIAGTLGSLLLLSMAGNAGLIYMVIRERRKDSENKDPEFARQDSPLTTRENSEPEHHEEGSLHTPPPTVERVPSRQPSTAVEPIAERLSTDAPPFPNSPRRSSQHPNEPILVQRNAETGSTPISRRSSVAATPELMPAPSPKPSETLPIEPSPPPSRQTSVLEPHEATPASSRKSSVISAREHALVSRQPSEAPSVPPPKEPTPPQEEPTPPQEEPTPPQEEPTPPSEPLVRGTTTHTPAPEFESEPESSIQPSATMPPEVLKPISHKTRWLDELQNEAAEAEPHPLSRTPSSPAPIVKAHTDEGPPNANNSV